MGTRDNHDQETFEAGIIALTSDVWLIADRRQFADQRAAMRWVRFKSSSLQRRFPLGRVRGSIVKPNDWLTLEVIRDGYEQKRLAGDAEYCLRPAVEQVVAGSVAKKADSPPMATEGSFDAPQRGRHREARAASRMPARAPLKPRHQPRRHIQSPRPAS